MLKYIGSIVFLGCLAIGVSASDDVSRYSGNPSTHELCVFPKVFGGEYTIRSTAFLTDEMEYNASHRVHNMNDFWKDNLLSPGETNVITYQVSKGESIHVAFDPYDVSHFRYYLSYDDSSTPYKDISTLPACQL
jgi:hypothetical protein